MNLKSTWFILPFDLQRLFLLFLRHFMRPLGSESHGLLSNGSRALHHYVGIDAPSWFCRFVISPAPASNNNQWWNQCCWGSFRLVNGEANWGADMSRGLVPLLSRWLKLKSGKSLMMKKALVLRRKSSWDLLVARHFVMFMVTDWRPTLNFKIPLHTPSRVRRKSNHAHDLESPWHRLL